MSQTLPTICESSLTTPSDKTQEFKPDIHTPSLSKEETELASTELLLKDLSVKFPRVERRYADPPVPLQTFGLFSFVPAKGATPNEKGIFGMAKMRGNFSTQTEAEAQAEKLIKESDSYHKIYTTYVGRPFPVTVSSDYSKETSEVDMRKDVTETISYDVKKKRDREEQEMREIREKEAQLKSDVVRDEKTPEYQHDLYTTLRVKKAQLSWTYLENEKKLNEIKEIIIKTRQEIDEMEQENSEYKNTYFEKYLVARSQSGLNNDMKQNNFLKFMVEDANLNF